jgi:hypothetical protein
MKHVIPALAALALVTLGLVGGARAAETQKLSLVYTRPANTTAYAAGQIICGTSSPCAPLAYAMSKGRGHSGRIVGASITLNSTTISNAAFVLEFYQGAPTLTGLTDGSAYSPKQVDIASGAYIGSANCPAPIAANTDNIWISCALDNPRNEKHFIADGSGNIYVAVQANGAYVPTSGELVQVNLSVELD